MSYRAGDYLAVLPHNPVGRRDARAQALRPRLRQPDRDPQGRGQHHARCRWTTRSARASCCSTTSSCRSRRRARRWRSWPTATRCPPEQAELDSAGRGRRTTSARCWASASACSTCWSATRPASSASPRSWRCCRRCARGSTRSRRRRCGTRTRCTLTVAVVDAPALSGQGRYQGMASYYLAQLHAGHARRGRGAVVERPLPPAGRARDADGDGLRRHRPGAVPRLPAGARGAGARTGRRSGRRCCSSAATTRTSTSSTATSSRRGRRPASSACGRRSSSSPRAT